MFAYIKGRLMKASSLHVVVETGGIGYLIHIPPSLISDLPPPESELELHLAFVVREQSHALYGFGSACDRDLFETLLGVSGVGPKLALSLIGHLSAEELEQAIQSEDIKTICRVPGIGKKGAMRLIIELRDKLSQIFRNHPSRYAVKTTQNVGQQKIQDAMNALINLGYTQAVAQKAIKQTLSEDEELELGDLITRALRNV